MTRALLKENAKRSFKTKYGESIVVALIMSAFMTGGASFTGSGSSNVDESSFSWEYSADSLGELISSIPEGVMYGFLGILGVTVTLSILVGIFLAPIFIVGGNRFFLKLRKGAHTGIGEVIGNFKDGNYKNIVITSFFQYLYIFLWSLLFVVPGIIKSYDYYCVNHILAVRPDIDRNVALKMSTALMKGHRWDAFVLELSFLGWILLGSLTCGILNIAYVNPYMYATLNEFYCYVRAEGIRSGIITPMDLPDYETPVYNGSTPFDAQRDTFFDQSRGFNPQNPQYAQNPQAPQYAPAQNEENVNQYQPNVEATPVQEIVEPTEATEPASTEDEEE